MQKQLRKDEVKVLNERIEKEFGIKEIFDKKDSVQEKDNLIYKNNKPLFFYYENKLVPNLKIILENNFLKTVSIDMNAIKFIIKGANLMRPGITEISDNIKKDEIVCIIDVTHKKPIALGISLFTSEEIKLMDKGIVIKTIHYIGDKIWENL